MSVWIIGGSVAVCVVLGALLTRARRQLAATRESFRVLASRAPMGILQANAAGMCIYANETWCEVSGLSLADTLGHRWSQAVHPDDVAAVMGKWEESVRERRPYVNEVRLLRPDGGIRHVLASGCPTHDDRGRVTGFIGTVLDITERRVAEREAREKESLLRTLVDHSSAAIYLKDTAGRYLLVNRRHLEIWPAMRDFRPGTTPFDWFPEEVARSFIATDAEVWRSGQTQTFTETIPQDGERRTFLSVKFPVFDDAGRVTAVGGISADITDLETARHDLAERERLLRTLIDVQENEKQLLCHEFHDGLIQYAVGSKMLLEALVERGLPEDCRSAIDSVIECLAKGIEDGRGVIRGIRPAALDDLGLQAAIEELAGELRDSGIEVEMKLDPAIDDVPSQLQTTLYRVVQESLNNARKHSGSGAMAVVALRSGDHVELTVTDFGRGFDPAATDGSGFGLVGIRERVRLAGGSSRVDAAAGRGTRVSVRLPLDSTAVVSG